MITEHPDWRKKFPTGPVRWDVTCDWCGLKKEAVPPHGHIHGVMFHGIDFSPDDYSNLGICRRRCGRWLCATCAPLN